MRLHPRRAGAAVPSPWQPVARALVSQPAAVSPQAPVLTRFDEKRVVRLVQSEVASRLPEITSLERLSRREVGRLADRVYDSLARRLLVERERRGLV